MIVSLSFIDMSENGNQDRLAAAQKASELQVVAQLVKLMSDNAYLFTQNPAYIKLVCDYLKLFEVEAKKMEVKGTSQGNLRGTG